MCRAALAVDELAQQVPTLAVVLGVGDGWQGQEHGKGGEAGKAKHWEHSVKKYGRFFNHHKLNGHTTSTPSLTTNDEYVGTGSR